MLLKTSFFPVFLFLLLGLGWMADQLKNPIFLSASHAQIDRTPVSPEKLSTRQAMLEMLDHLVTRQREYRERHGRFSFLLSRVLAPSPFKQQSDYEVRVIQANTEHLVIFAFSEEAGRLVDQVFIDENYRVNANFVAPDPSLQYIRSVALGHLNALKDGSSGADQLEPTQFKNYFRYSFSTDSAGHKTVRAVGLKDPVLGLELQSSGEASAGVLESKALFQSPIISHVFGSNTPSLENLSEIQQRLSRTKNSERKISSLKSLDSVTSLVSAESVESVESVESAREDQNSPASERITIVSEPQPLVIEPLEPSSIKKR